MSTRADPRPLRGEPLPLDLLNTRWTGDDGPHDLLELPDGLTIWLASTGLAGIAPDTPATLAALLTTRAALAALMQPETVDPARAREMLNETLRHGHIRRLLGDHGPLTTPETDAPEWIASWRAAEHYLRLLDERPERLRQCANPVCTLRFYDVSKAGARRWCSMATCGNRAKYRSHATRNQR